MLFGDGAVPYYRKRICHVCGDKIIPRAFCPSCGHLLCGECRRSAASATPAHAPEAHHALEARYAVDRTDVTTPGSSVLAVNDEPEKSQKANLTHQRVEQALKDTDIMPSGKRNSLVGDPSRPNTHPLSF